MCAALHKPKASVNSPFHTAKLLVSLFIVISSKSFIFLFNISSIIAIPLGIASVLRTVNFHRYLSAAGAWFANLFQRSSLRCSKKPQTSGARVYDANVAFIALRE